MSQERYTASTITDEALDALYENANRGWRRGDEWKARAEQAEAAIERVRALHSEWPIFKKTPGVCAYCTEDDESHDHLEFPCPTIRALDGAEQPKEQDSK